ncbi:hypothetical protein L1987_72138 [Smallanthus sonchifolius]|uniref:Uncharacterized protein n=1 Tax=Smallanthus sonchifolius TaxID=185202 RepID=A0ACB9AV87_9ASTR|nr:hypothetical protein L1987_72138 [Smallanthus sonchifolius]
MRLRLLFNFSLFLFSISTLIPDCTIKYQIHVEDDMVGLKGEILRIRSLMEIHLLSRSKFPNAIKFVHFSNLIVKYF